MINETALIDRLVQDAMNLSGHLSNAADDLILAIEKEATTRRAEKDARQSYESIEAEFTFEALAEINGKNSETRKAELEARIVGAKRVGPLVQPFIYLSAAAEEHAEAEMALEQMKVSFRAVTVAAELQAAMLRAVSSR